ncbi:MAG TPA: maleylpyruvate isomerase N-terminal domain-containing protein [Nitrolancea sp.]
MSSRDDLLARMNLARAELESVVTALRGREEADLGDGWRVRDLIAHLALWERVAAWKLGGGDVPYAEGLADRDPWDLNAFNEGMRERWRDRPLNDVITEFDAAHAALVEVVSNASEEDCAPGGAARTAIDEDGAGHYIQHLSDLRSAMF